MRRLSGIATFSLLAVMLVLYVNAGDSPDRTSQGKKPAAEMNLLEQLQYKRQAIIAAFGADHPAVKKIEDEIERAQTHAAAQPEMDPLQRFRAAGDDLTEDELRQTIGSLIERILRLEAEVQRLRKAPPRLELLR